MHTALAALSTITPKQAANLHIDLDVLGFGVGDEVGSFDMPCDPATTKPAANDDALKSLRLIALFLLFTATALLGFAPLAQAGVQEDVWIVKAQDTVKQKLKDPRSAQFRNVFFSQKGGVPVACGEVNSKNSLGGYGGYQRFIGTDDIALTFLEEEVSDFGNIWQQLCR